MSEGKRGEYIVLEGPDGAGKSTQMTLLRQALERAGVSYIKVREPGGTALGDALREIIKDARFPRSPQTNFDLFNLCRRELAEQVIKPTLASGISVISDRNWFSSVAYQGFAEGMVVADITKKSEDTLGDAFMPDRIVIIGIPLEISEDRLQARGTSEQDLFERAGPDFRAKLHEGYKWLSSRYNVPLINGNQAPEDVHRDINQHLGNLALGTQRK